MARLTSGLSKKALCGLEQVPHGQKDCSSVNCGKRPACDDRKQSLHKDPVRKEEVDKSNPARHQHEQRDPTNQFPHVSPKLIDTTNVYRPSLKSAS